LTTLRRELGGTGADCIMASRERIGIGDGPGLWIDVREFDRLVAEGSGERALTLCRGDLLTDLDDDWVLEERQLYRERIAAVLGELGAAYEEAGDNRRAVTFPVLPSHSCPPICKASCAARWHSCGRGAAMEDGEPFADRFRALRPELDLVEPRPYVEFQSMFDDPPGLRNYWTADYLGELSDDALGVFHEHATRMPVPSS
jgi:hypothetical protein